MATKNLVPRAAHEGQIGTADKPFLKVIADEVDIGSPIAKYSRMQTIENDCWAALAYSFAPFYGGAVAGGTFAKQLGLANHPGLVCFRSSTTTVSGYFISSDGSVNSAKDMILAGGETFEFIFRSDTNSGTTTRFGFMTTDAVNGVFIEIVNNVLVGKTIKSGAGAGNATTGTNYATITDGVFYRAKIVMNADASVATFTLVTCADGVQVWTDTLNTYIPILPVGINMSSSNTGTTAVNLITLDWYCISSSHVLVR